MNLRVIDEDERWRIVKGFEGAYEVSNLGRVRSISRWIDDARGCRRLLEGRILQQKEANSGRYLSVNLSIDGQATDVHVHRLVAIAFVVGTGPVVRHMDGNGHNNHAANLAWGTPVENEADKALHGRRLEGVRHPRAVLNVDQVLLIREMSKNGHTQFAIAGAMGITRGVVCNVLRRKAYTSVS